MAPTKFWAALVCRSENLRFEAYAGGGAGFFCSLRRKSASTPTTTPTITIPIRIGRRAEVSFSVVGFMLGSSRPSMAGLYYRCASLAEDTAMHCAIIGYFGVIGYCSRDSSDNRW